MVAGILMRTQAVVWPTDNGELGVSANYASSKAAVWQEAEVSQAWHMHRFVHGTVGWSNQPANEKMKKEPQEI